MVEQIQGIITLQDDIVTVHEIPVSKILLNFNGKRVKLLLSCGTDTLYEYEGIADLFYYEGSQPYYPWNKVCE